MVRAAAFDVCRRATDPYSGRVLRKYCRSRRVPRSGI